MDERFMQRYKIAADNIKHLRLLHGYTQEALAEETGIGRTSLTKIETAKACLTLDQIYILSDFFDVSVDILLGRRLW